MARSTRRASRARARFAPGGGGFIYPSFSISLDADTMAIGSPTCTLVGNFVTSPDEATVSLLDDDGSKFKLIGKELHAGDEITTDDDGDHQNITVRMLWAGRTMDQVFTINLTDIILADGTDFTSGDPEDTVISAVTTIPTGATLSILSQDTENFVALQGSDLVVGSAGALVDSGDTVSVNVTLRATKDGKHWDVDFTITANAAG